jgi:hypothetical protein
MLNKYPEKSLAQTFTTQDELTWHQLEFAQLILKLFA